MCWEGSGTLRGGVDEAGTEGGGSGIVVRVVVRAGEKVRQCRESMRGGGGEQRRVHHRQTGSTACWGGGSDEGTLGLKSERKVFVDAGAVKVTMDVPVLPTGGCSWRKELNRNNGLGWAAVSTCMCTEEVEKRKEVMGKKGMVDALVVVQHNPQSACPSDPARPENQYIGEFDGGGGLADTLLQEVKVKGECPDHWDAKCWHQRAGAQLRPEWRCLRSAVSRHRRGSSTYIQVNDKKALCSANFFVSN